ncbi:MAG TPA: ABC transporter permease [Ferruginibacter sp.]|mgnify:CR=1 FL=1|nr:ABC transporter permease [Ferruginibacter sp.]HPH89976.1 ABC transporter permease [Ferruginibacter sp.]
MIHTYFKTAFRNLWRNRQFSVINLAGLALGITVFLLIMQYVAFEWSANRFNTNYESLYRVNLKAKNGTTDYYLPPGFAPVIKKNLPSVEAYVRVADGIGGGVISSAGKTPKEDKTFREENVLYVDGSFLSVFSFPLVSGTTSLAEPKTVAISETMSKKLFGGATAVGNVIQVSNQFGTTDYTINAVYQQPGESDIKADVLLSIHTLESAANRDGNDWADPNGTGSGFVNIYLQLKKGADGEKVSQSLTRFIRSIHPGSKEDNLVLQPFNNLHLAPSFDYPFQTFGNLLLVVVFFSVAVLILLIAWVNYINLSTAQALNRAKEVGVRKVLGASRRQLVVQYLSETLLLTVGATAVALLLVKLCQHTFNEFTGKNLSLLVLNNGWFWFCGIVLIAVGSLLSGSFVAFVLTSFKPIAVIRGKAAAATKGFSLRKGLVVFQFTISIVFIIATIVLYNQLQYMKTESLGMNLNQLLVIQGPTVSSEGQAEKNVSFKNSLAQLPFVKKYAASNNVPGIGYNFSADGITKLNPQQGDDKKSYSMFICDHNFFDTYGISFSQGQSFNKEDAESSWNNVRKVIINEKAAQLLGFDSKQNIVGQKINWGETFEIIGVVKDYHHLSLREAIKPTVYLGSVSFSFFTVQTDVNNLQSKISTIKAIYSSTFPGNPFEYFFADEKYDQQYQEEQKLGKVFILAAFIAILIACMGLFGLAAFSAKQRIKEIGIRKVLGASITDITTLLSKDFIQLVFVSILLASPIAWWAMNKWLQDFAYRINISWTVFLIAGMAALLIALCTVSFQAIRAALANPVRSLRTE